MLIAETRSLVFDSLFYGELVQLFKKRFAVFCSMRLKNELGSRVLYLLEQFEDSLPAVSYSSLIWTGCTS